MCILEWIAQHHGHKLDLSDPDAYVKFLMWYNKQPPAPGAWPPALVKAVDALSPRSQRAYRLGPPFDPFLGSCPYPFPRWSGGPLVPPPSAIAKRTASQFDSTLSSSSSSSKHARKNAQPKSDLTAEDQLFPAGMPEGQTTVRAVEARLSEHVNNMERSRPMHERILEEPRLRIWLPLNTKSNFVLQHVVAVVRALLVWRPSLMFKVGIAVDAYHRFHTADYAYMTPLSQLRDGVRYEGMHVVYIHPTRSVIAMLEHCAMNHFLELPEFKSHCANKKRDMDTHIAGDESDDDRYDAVGPHSVYIVWGERM